MLRVRLGHHLAHVAAALALLAGGCRREPESALAVTVRGSWDFEGHTPGAGAPGFIVATTNLSSGGEHGKWAVLEEPGGGRSYALVSTRSRGRAFNLAYVESFVLADIDLRVRVQRIAGREDQGGGLLWRLQDVQNYYVARWNPLERNVRLYVCRDGKRTILARLEELDADPERWHTLRVRMKGPRIEVRFDEVALDPVDDGAFPGAGRIGLWTKADAATKFDDLHVAPVR